MPTWQKLMERRAERGVHTYPFNGHEHEHPVHTLLLVFVPDERARVNAA